jgi:hypothetical protein
MITTAEQLFASKKNGFVRMCLILYDSHRDVNVAANMTVQHTATIFRNQSREKTDGLNGNIKIIPLLDPG